SGMYVRLAFAVAAHLEPEILIVDEVLAVGDAEFQKKCLGKMQEVATQHGRTVLFVSHSLTAVLNLCTRGLLFDHGRIVRTGAIQEVCDAYADTWRSTEPLQDRGRFLRNLLLVDGEGVECTNVMEGQRLRFS